MGRSGRTHSFTPLVGVLYALGLSHRGIETAFGLLGHHVDHVSSGRDIRRLGKSVKRRLPERKASIVGVGGRDMGEARPVGVVVDVGGRVLNIELTGEGFQRVGSSR